MADFNSDSTPDQRLEAAVRTGDVESAGQALKDGADVNMKVADGDPLIGSAIYNNASKEMLGLLLSRPELDMEKATMPYPKLAFGEIDNLSPLQVAVVMGNKNAVEQLLADKRTDLDHKASDGQTAQDYAKWNVEFSIATKEVAATHKEIASMVTKAVEKKQEELRPGRETDGPENKTSRLDDQATLLKLAESSGVKIPGRLDESSKAGTMLASMVEKGGADAPTVGSQGASKDIKIG